MKNILVLIFMLTSLNACAMSKRSVSFPERKLQDKLYRPCEDFETSEPIGKLCNRTCKKRSKKGKCKKWRKSVVKDFNDPDTFKWFRAGTFIMIDEDQVF